MMWRALSISPWLADRATGRIATGQKVSLAEVEDATVVTVGDDQYYYYEAGTSTRPLLS